MEMQWQADRSALRELQQSRPDLSLKEMAVLLKRSYSWAKRWSKRLQQAPPTDLAVLHSRSRARKTSPPDWDAQVLQRLEEIRQHPPANLQRTPGPKTILYYLQHDPHLQQLGCRLPQAASTVWKLLHRLGLLTPTSKRQHEPEPPCVPLEEVQVDFKDVSTVPPDPLGKRQHVIETCNFVDAGTSLLLMAEPHDDFHAQTALEAVIAFLRRYGCPQRMSFDHDPRWLGSPSGRDFPSALQRMLFCLGIEPRICPPQRPDRNAFVERYHRSYKYECLRIFRPKTLEEVRAVTLSFEQHYNEERPHQGRACGNRPPRQAFPTLPTLPALPEAVQADRWLWSLHQRVFARTVGADGCVAVNHETLLPLQEPQRPPCGSDARCGGRGVCCLSRSGFLAVVSHQGTRSWGPGPGGIFGPDG